MAKKIFLVEDDAFVRDLYNEILTKKGYEVILAFDGDEALTKAQNDTFDLVLLDVMLPKLTGIEVLKEMRKEGSPHKTTPIYLLTNLGEETIAKEAYKLGANGYLLKAKYLPTELIKEIEKFFVSGEEKGTLKTLDTSNENTELENNSMQDSS